MRVGRPHIDHYRPPNPRDVRSTYPVDPFWRRAVELYKRGHTWKELAERCEMHPDMFTRACGLRRSEHGRYRENVQLKTAIRLSRGLDLDPVDAGL